MTRVPGGLRRRPTGGYIGGHASHEQPAIGLGRGGTQPNVIDACAATIVLQYARGLAIDCEPALPTVCIPIELQIVPLLCRELEVLVAGQQFPVRADAKIEHVEELILVIPRNGKVISQTNPRAGKT